MPEVDVILQVFSGVFTAVECGIAWVGIEHRVQHTKRSDEASADAR